MEVKFIRWTGESEPTTEDMEEMFKKRDMDYYSFSNEKGYIYPEHEHEYNKFLVVASGKMKWKIAGNEKILGMGDAVALPSGTSHEVEVLEDCECWEGHF